MPARPCRLAPGWMLGALPEGIVLVGPSEEISVDLVADPSALGDVAGLLARRAPAREIARVLGEPETEAGRLLEELERRGAFAQRSSGRDGLLPGRPLLGVLLGEAESWELVWTAEEALMTCSELSAAAARALLEDFVAGLGPPPRRRAYSWALERARPTVWGDAPDGELLRRAISQPNDPRHRDPQDRDAGHRDRHHRDGEVRMIDLRRGAEVRVPATEAGRVGARRPHRLGTVRRLGPLRSQACDALGLVVSVAEHAAPDPRRAEPRGADMRAKGVALDRAEADLVARAEAAERQAAGDLRGRSLVRAPAQDLEGAIPGDRLFRLNERQYETSPLAPFDPSVAHVWGPAVTVRGAPCHVLAQAVFIGVPTGRGPRVLPAATSGVAAGASRAEAEAAALRELVERDAFMWTWVQRISRERIGTASLPPALRRRVEAVRARDLEVALVDLTLETDPVVLCAIHDGSSLTLGARCHPDPASAAEGAFREAAVTRFAARPRPAPDPREVRTPADHDALHRGDPAAAARAAFLHANTDTKELGDVRGAGRPIADALTQLGGPVGEPVVIDLTTPRSRPFHVVRAVVPGLIPITFGHDREPLGLPLLATPRRDAGGAFLGRELDLARAGPLPPHPFA